MVMVGRSDNHPVFSWSAGLRTVAYDEPHRTGRDPKGRLALARCEHWTIRAAVRARGHLWRVRRAAGRWMAGAGAEGRAALCSVVACEDRC